MSKKRVAKILDFSTGAKAVVPGSKKSLEAHGFRADFFTNDSSGSPVYHYVVIRVGSLEILGWGQERSAEEAERAALDCMTTLGRRASAAG